MAQNTEAFPIDKRELPLPQDTILSMYKLLHLYSWRYIITN